MGKRRWPYGNLRVNPTSMPNRRRDVSAMHLGNMIFSVRRGKNHLIRTENGRAESVSLYIFDFRACNREVVVGIRPVGSGATAPAHAVIAVLNPVVGQYECPLTVTIRLQFDSFTRRKSQA